MICKKCADEHEVTCICSMCLNENQKGNECYLSIHEKHLEEKKNEVAWITMPVGKREQKK